VTATPPAAELGTDDRNDLDAGLAQQRVGLRVAVLGDHHAGFEGNRVVATVPLLALGRVQVARGPDHPQSVQAEGLGDHLNEWLRAVVDYLDSRRLVTRPQRERVYRVSS
jgi:hypothetical protein